MFRERAFCFTDAHRLGDLRRLLRAPYSPPRRPSTHRSVSQARLTRGTQVTFTVPSRGENRSTTISVHSPFRKIRDMLKQGGVRLRAALARAVLLAFAAPRHLRRRSRSQLTVIDGVNAPGELTVIARAIGSFALRQLAPSPPGRCAVVEGGETFSFRPVGQHVHTAVVGGRSCSSSTSRMVSRDSRMGGDWGR